MRHKIIYPPGSNAKLINFWIEGTHHLSDQFILGGATWKLTGYHFHKNYTLGSATPVKQSLDENNGSSDRKGDTDLFESTGSNVRV